MIICTNTHWPYVIPEYNVVSRRQLDASTSFISISCIRGTCVLSCERWEHNNVFARNVWPHPSESRTVLNKTLRCTCPVQRLRPDVFGHTCFWLGRGEFWTVWHFTNNYTRGDATILVKVDLAEQLLTGSKVKFPLRQVWNKYVLSS